MSKRVANKKGAHAGSRCKRVRIGYFRKRNLQMLAKQRDMMMKDLTEKKKTEEERDQTLGSLAYVGQQIRQLVPKALLRRHQGR